MLLTEFVSVIGWIFNSSGAGSYRSVLDSLDKSVFVVILFSVFHGIFFCSLYFFSVSLLTEKKKKKKQNLSGECSTEETHH